MRRGDYYRVITTLASKLTKTKKQYVYRDAKPRYYILPEEAPAPLELCGVFTRVPAKADVIKQEQWYNKIRTFNLVWRSKAFREMFHILEKDGLYYLFYFEPLTGKTKELGPYQRDNAFILCGNKMLRRTVQPHSVMGVQPILTLAGTLQFEGVPGVKELTQLDNIQDNYGNLLRKKYYDSYGEN